VRLIGRAGSSSRILLFQVATTERDYYLILGVERSATDDEIKRAYRKLAQQWHPDVNAEPTAHDRFTEINEAYQVLSDPERRGRYDMFGQAGLGGGAGAGFEGFGGFSDIFDAFFGGSAGAASARRGRPQPGADLRYDLRIAFDEAVKGTDKEIEFSVLQRCETCQGSGAKVGTEAVVCPQCSGRGEVRSVRQTMLGQMVNVSACPRCRGEGKIVESPCETCRGDGRTERRRTLRVSIPAGIDEGHQIRLSNEGEVGPRGGPAGSLYVAVHVQAHASLKREGTELFYEAAISIAQAALGTRIIVPTVDGEEEVEIKPGTQPDTEIRLRGKGVPHLRRSGARGDLHVLVDVVVPTKLSRKGRELLAAYAEEAGESVGSGGGGLREKLGLG
jgi:molecular chaperone DnaJ